MWGWDSKHRLKCTNVRCSSPHGSPAALSRYILGNVWALCSCTWSVRWDLDMSLAICRGHGGGPWFWLGQLHVEPSRLWIWVPTWPPSTVILRCDQCIELYRPPMTDSLSWDSLRRLWSWKSVGGQREHTFHMDHGSLDHVERVHELILQAWYLIL